MTKIINTLGLHTIDFLDKYENGRFRFITKTRAGYISCHDAQDFQNDTYKKHPEELLRAYKKGVIQSIQFQPLDENGNNEYNTWLTIFARQGKKIHFIDEAILRDLTVGTINSCWYNTALYKHSQYEAVNSKTWASKAFVMNETEPEKEVA